MSCSICLILDPLPLPPPGIPFSAKLNHVDRTVCPKIYDPLVFCLEKSVFKYAIIINLINYHWYFYGYERLSEFYEVCQVCQLLSSQIKKISLSCKLFHGCFLNLVNINEKLKFSIFNSIRTFPHCCDGIYIHLPRIEDSLFNILTSDDFIIEEIASMCISLANIFCTV